MENIDFGEKICCVRWLQIQNTRPHTKFQCRSSTNRDTACILLAKVKKNSKTWKALTLEKKLVAQWRIDFLLTPLMAYWFFVDPFNGVLVFC